MNNITNWLDTIALRLSPYDFYRIIFPDGELDIKDAKNPGKYTGIAIEVTDKKKKIVKTNKKTGITKETMAPLVYRHTVTNDLDTIRDICSRQNFCLMAPLSYAGKKRSAENARFLYGIVIDLDEIIFDSTGEPRGLIDMWVGHIHRAKRIPHPTMIVSSGTGVHLYYVFEKPIPLFENIAKQLQRYKHELTRLCWNEGIVNIRDDKDIQYEGIYQGFRVPGTITKSGKTDGTNERAQAFLTGEKISVAYMNQFVDSEYKIKEFTYKSDLTLADARELYPEWYEERIIKGNKNKVLHPWALSRDVYDWWKRQIYSNARVKHRYWCLWCLAIYAQKCSFYDPVKNPNPVTQEELEADAWELREYLDTLTDDPQNRFTEIDVIEALEAFEDKFISYPRKSIKYKSGIQFTSSVKRREKGKRLKQDVHLMGARAIQEINDKVNGTNWRSGNGRPKGSKNKVYKKKEMIEAYLKKHPKAKVSKIAADLSISRTTVYKYLNPEPIEKEIKVETGHNKSTNANDISSELKEKDYLQSYLDELLKK